MLGAYLQQDVLDYIPTQYNVRFSIQKFTATYNVPQFARNWGNEREYRTNRDFECTVAIDFPYYNMIEGRKDTYNDEVLYKPGTGENIGYLEPYYRCDSPLEAMNDWEKVPLYNKICNEKAAAREDTGERKSMNKEFFEFLDQAEYRLDDEVYMEGGYTDDGVANDRWIYPTLEAINPKDKDKLKLTSYSYGFSGHSETGGWAKKEGYAYACTFFINFRARYQPQYGINTNQKNTDVDIQQFKDLVCKCLVDKKHGLIHEIFLNEPNKIPPMKYKDEFYPKRTGWEGEVLKYYDSSIDKLKPQYRYKPKDNSIFQPEWWKELLKFDMIPWDWKDRSHPFQGQREDTKRLWRNLWMDRADGNEFYQQWIEENKKWIENNEDYWEEISLPPYVCYGPPKYGDLAHLNNRGREGKAPLEFEAPTYITRNFSVFRTNWNVPLSKEQAKLGMGKPGMKEKLKF